MADPSVELWALDAVHFQQHGSRCRMWIPPEVPDPLSLHHPTRKQVGYFGSVRLSDGRFHVQRQAERFNAQTCWCFFRSLRRACRNSSQPIVVIADHARFHHAVLHKEWRERMAPEFELSFLPPYSPELNPIERVWKLTRRLCLHNRYFPNLAVLIDVVEDRFERWCRGKRRFVDYAQTFKTHSLEAASQDQELLRANRCPLRPRGSEANTFAKLTIKCTV